MKANINSKSIFYPEKGKDVITSYRANIFANLNLLKDTKDNNAFLISYKILCKYITKG